mmetsp:Transcript_8543/g.38836  ORF Transcript_8543/g.38836 Transcript_8543/m.38836 type:complete len:829 (+) Transcript_8543:70-2556(+)
MTMTAMGSTTAAVGARVQLGRGVGVARSPRRNVASIAPRAPSFRVAPTAAWFVNGRRAMTGRRTARVVHTRAAFSDKEGDASQLERQAGGNGGDVNGSSHLPNGGLNAQGDVEARNGKNGSAPTNAPGPETPKRPREPLSPLGRFFLKLKLYALMPLVWLSKTLSVMMRNKLFAALFGIFIATSAALGVRAVQMRKAAVKPRAAPTVLYSHFVKDLTAKKVTAVRFEEGTGRILYELKEGAVSSAPPKPTPTTKGKVNIAPSTTPSTTPAAAAPKRGSVLQTKRIPDEKLMTRLEAAGVEFGSVAAPATSVLSKGALTAMALWIPLIPLYFMFRNMANKQGGGGNAKKARTVPDEKPVTFADVAGVDAAKAELVELVEMLKSADKYKGVKNRLPTGCLLVGPPGTGKTLLAKAVAGEAGVPFFSCAASEFVELFVGVGASRVRDLFEKAKSKAPCIVFIDEIDAVGRQRGSGMGGGNDEREQTINQLLTEMDGFEGNTGVIVLAATNRPDVLDSALLRPGRFDRQVTVDLPDVAGRIRILKVHARGKTIGKDVDYDKVARRTPGFSGAALQNLLNEAAILAARRDLTEISKEEIADALERIVAGAAKEGAVMSEQKKKLVAYHEAGHAIVGALMPEYDPVTKISIVPRGNAGGLTFFAPSEERLESGLYSRTYLENQMAVAMGGRVAEELIFGAENVTTGASGDFQQVSRTARMMIEQMGFSEKIGQIALKTGGGQSFIGNDAGRGADYSQTTADIVDGEVQALVEVAYRRAKDLVQENIECLHAVADVLLDKENIDGDEFEQIMLKAKAKLYLKEDNASIDVPFKTA